MLWNIAQNILRNSFLGNGQLSLSGKEEHSTLVRSRDYFIYFMGV